MKRLVISLTIVTLMSAANVFAMKENVINSGLALQRLNALAGPSKLGAAKFNAAKGTATFSLADYLAWVKAGKPGSGGAETGEGQLKTTPAVTPQEKTPAVTTKVDRNAIIKETIPLEIAYVTDGLIAELLKHPLLGTNKEDAVATIDAMRKALVGKEQDPRIQALPTRAQFQARMQTAPKRDLTYAEGDFLVKAAEHKKSAEVYPMYLQLHPDIIFDDEFSKLMEKAAAGETVVLMLDYSKFKFKP